MPRVNRSELVSEDEVQLFHLSNRCVRQTFLCGRNPDTGRDYSHRKQWIRDRLEELAGIYAIEVIAFAVMSNHLHVVVRTRPDIVRGWSDEEVARRWWNLYPGRRTPLGGPEVPTDAELKHIRLDTKGLQEKRKRLSSISWFMRCVAEPIARRGNREDNVTGRFWEGRFHSDPLPDETALAACMTYVDLNPVRARVAATPEASRFTSVRERIADRQTADSAQSPDARHQRIEHGDCAGWLAPVELEPPRRRARNNATGRRASNKGCLPMTLDDYLNLVDWTGRQFRRDKPGRIPATYDTILRRLDCSGDVWLDLVKNFRRQLRHYLRRRPAAASTGDSRRRSSRAGSQSLA